MIRHVWSILCSSSSIDETSNNISLFTVLEQLSVSPRSARPEVDATERVTLPLNSEIITLWERMSDEPQIGHFKVRIVSPQDVELYKGPPAVLTLSDVSKPRLRTRIQVGGFPYVGPGRYSVRIQQQTGDTGRGRWKEVAQLPLLIEEAEPPTAQG